eukprot:TRINITY_DN6015_c0_g1_i6.p4 TRINITY_DN6015_c0_g1~~TRINITY_DN6015_c0_g1_i6.p4  ORF type:complete len:107 (-),score=36.14 TRINITY_DN6015_c0_g1_i6:195-515(-)
MLQYCVFFFSSRRRHTRCREVSWARRCVQETDQRRVHGVAKYGGSISAEHGIGLAKAPYIHLSKSKACLEAMQAIKKVLDPQGIMCPYKVLSSSRQPKNHFLISKI